MEYVYERINEFVMQFDVLVGNPPYCGIKRSQIPVEYDSYLKTGFRSFYPFVSLVSHLKEAGLGLFVTPQSWLSDFQAISFRCELFKQSKLTYLNVETQPKCWDKIAKIGQISVFILEHKRKNHNPSILFYKGRIPTLRNEVEKNVFQKIMNNDFQKIKLFDGQLHYDIKSGIYTPNFIDQTQSEKSYLDRHGEIKRDKIKFNKSFEDKIKIANDRNEKFVCFCNFGRAPFKIIGKNPNRIKIPVRIIEPIYVAGTYCIISTNEPHKMIRYVQSNVAKFIWQAFFSNRSFTRTLNEVLPNIIHMLPENFNDSDIYKIFDLNQKEINCVEELAKIYGK